MALLGLRRAENVPGDFYVDSSCIDCDLCRQISPDTFRREGEQSAVYHQPGASAEQLSALKALVTCPTASIGTARHHSAKEAAEAYPERIEGEVYFCGFAAQSSYGASSYLIVRPEGNVLVDSPRFARPLAKRIAALGGIKLLFLTHRDDVADHNAWAQHFGAERVMHRDDMGRALVIERSLAGQDPIPLAGDLLAIPTPGHTRGHMVLLYRGRFLFTGDHLQWSEARRSLYASRGVCWYSWPQQVRSVERLLDYSFEWVLPGHGRRKHAPAAQMREYLTKCLQQMTRE
ncbi:MAG: MBL fold metallo-hydrolase [Acidobacteria bacterium]|nr:MAG: MBL fold metallo-hydrolase [Acidobacteriota bacterium]PYV42088.1 MAG: MBL fold metallo-hydrolase [Acidobacteriota bacterium]